MGYAPKRKIYNLSFEAHPGLEVKAASVSTGAFLEFAEIHESARGAGLSEIRGLFERFADQALRSWNLEEEDADGERTPVPATLAGLLSQEIDFVFEIIDAWTDTIAGVDENLEAPSLDGNQSQVVSLPMEVSSPSRAS